MLTLRDRRIRVGGTTSALALSGRQWSPARISGSVIHELLGRIERIFYSGVPVPRKGHKGLRPYVQYFFRSCVPSDTPPGTPNMDPAAR